MSEHSSRFTARLTRPAVVLEVGLGGFFEGILVHQILQWHHMLSGPTSPDSLPNLQLNAFVDGLSLGRRR